MATVSKSELAQRLLRKLGVVGAGQTASGEDLALAGEKVVAVHEALTALGKTRWTLADVPAFAAEPYALMASVLAGPEFGAAPDPGAWLAGLRMIAAGVSVAPSDEPITSEHF